jgi:DNA replication protein DnaC
MVANKPLKQFDLRSTYPDKLEQILRRDYPKMQLVEMKMVSWAKRLFKIGIPYAYLEAVWDDYQAENREAALQVIRFADTLDSQILGGGGLVINGTNGSGKSFLSYMVAKAAMLPDNRGETFVPRAICFTVPEYLEKKKYQYLNPAPFDELLGMIDAADVVVIDNLNRESERLGWAPQDLFEMVERCVGGRGHKAVIINTNLTGHEYAEQTGGSVLSRTKYFDKVELLRNQDFRSKVVDMDELQRVRRGDGIVVSHCFRPSMLLSKEAKTYFSANAVTPHACERCAYRTRLYLCQMRLRKQWKSLKSKSKS